MEEIDVVEVVVDVSWASEVVNEGPPVDLITKEEYLTDLVDWETASSCFRI